MRFFNQGGDSLFHIQNEMTRHSGDLKWLYTISSKRNLTVKLSSSFLHQQLETLPYTFKANQKIFYSEIAYVQSMKKMDIVCGININGNQFINQSAFSSALINQHYQTAGLFLQNTWKPLAKLTVESGLRGDYNSLYGFLPQFPFFRCP